MGLIHGGHAHGGAGSTIGDFLGLGQPGAVQPPPPPTVRPFAFMRFNRSAVVLVLAPVALATAAVPCRAVCGA